MRWKGNRGLRFALIAVCVTVSASAAYAYTASNSMPSTTLAGEGASGITPYTVSGISYTIDTVTVPTSITQVSFTVNGAAPGPNQVKAMLTPPGTWFPCVYNSGTSVATCTTSPSPSLSSATQLTVVAVQ